MKLGELGPWGVEDLRRVEGGETMIKICCKKPLNYIYVHI